MNRLRESSKPKEKPKKTKRKPKKNQKKTEEEKKKLPPSPLRFYRFYLGALEFKRCSGIQKRQNYQQSRSQSS